MVMRSTMSLLAAALLGACGVFGGEAATGPDAGSGDADAADAGVDAVPDGAVLDGASGSFCAAHAAAAFCTDFEDATASPFGFDDSYVADAGPLLELVKDRGASGVQSVRLHADLADDIASWIRKALPGIPAGRARYELSFAFSVAESATSYAVVGAIWFVNETDASIHGLTLRGEEMAGGSFPSTEKRPVGAGWHRASITLTRAAAGYTRDVTLDGQPSGTVTGIDLDGLDIVDIRLGAYFVEKAVGSLDVSFDDVVVFVSPD
jgi:hypothetical protein